MKPWVFIIDQDGMFGVLVRWAIKICGSRLFRESVSCPQSQLITCILPYVLLPIDLLPCCPVRCVVLCFRHRDTSKVVLNATRLSVDNVQPTGSLL